MVAKYGLGFVSALAMAACGQAGTSADDGTKSGQPTRIVANAAAAQTGSGRPARATTMTAADTPSGQCTNIMGHMTDPDPAGRNVRDAPGTNGRIVGVIPAVSANMQDTRPATFSIIGSRNGWLLIENAGFAEREENEATPTVYSGRGWISGRGMTVNLQTSLGFAQPSHGAPITFDMREAGGVVGSTEIEGFRMRGIAGCSGNWVQVDWEAPGYRGVSAIGFNRSAVVSEDPLIIRAWSAGVCNNQETTCDGTDGDTPERAFADQTTNPLR